MNNYPDFSSQGYQVIRELGRNREGGRITWLASVVGTTQQVVLKQFCFAQAGSDWAAFTAYEREIQVLQGLNHPGIPRYLGAFATSDGFCMIQAYVNAASLAVPRSFEPEEIKQIALSTLEILIYLQNRLPPVIHRDIKPENILVDADLNVYLIDFGFARIGSQEVSGSSVFKGTPGFIPPEQLRKPTAATDLYGLGATLICLLTGTQSTGIQNLTDEDDPYLIQFRHLVPRLSLRFVDWLEKMVKPRLRDRYPDAKTALDTLKPLYVFRVPEVKLNKNTLTFQATQLGEKLVQTLSIQNSVPETLLEGKWEVAPHLHDPPHTPDTHAWIFLSPKRFKSNVAECKITIDTSRLAAGKNYERNLLLHTNSLPETHSITIKLQTAPLPLEIKKPPYKNIMVLLIFSTVSTAITVSSLSLGFTTVGIVMTTIVLLGTILGAEARIRIGTWGWIGVGLGVLLAALAIFGMATWSSTLAVLSFGAIAGAILGLIFGIWVDIAMTIFQHNFFSEMIRERSVAGLTLLTAALGISVGTGLSMGFLSGAVLLSLVGTGCPWAVMLLYPVIKRRWLITRYRQSEQHLIQP
jgi:serine/threonine protein kinase